MVMSMMMSMTSISSMSERAVHGYILVSIVRGCIILCQHNLEASTLGIAVEMPDCCRIKCCGDRKRDQEKTNKNRAKNKMEKDLTNRSSSTSIFQVGYLIQFTNFFFQKISTVLLLIELQVLEIPVSKNLHVLVWVTATVNVPDMKWLITEPGLEPETFGLPYQYSSI